MRKLVTMSLLSVSILFADDIPKLAQEFGLFAGTKASVQWKRIFSSQRRMKGYNFDTLTPNQIEKLKIYLIEHAADSDKPVVPGL